MSRGTRLRTRYPRHEGSEAASLSLPTWALLAFLTLVVALCTAPDSSHAKSSTRAPVSPQQRQARTLSAWHRALSTWYGPGFYGHRTACLLHGRPIILTRHTRGVAHRTLPCGTRLILRYHGRVIRTTVIDRGPYSGALFDLTARTAMDLENTRRPYTLRHLWRLA